MKLSRPLLHTARIINAVVFWPVLGLVLWLQLTPSPPEAPDLPHADKLAHFLAYLVLAAMAAASFRRRRPVIVAVLGLIALGALIEVLQGQLGRETSALDALANAAGSVTGAGLARLAIEPMRRRFADQAAGERAG